MIEPEWQHLAHTIKTDHSVASIAQHWTRTICAIILTTPPLMIGSDYSTIATVRWYFNLMPPPVRRGKCPAMCAGKIKCPALYAPVCPYIRASGPIPPEPPDRLNRSGPPDLSGPIPDRRVF